MPGNSHQRRQVRRQEQRITESVLKRIPNKYKFDICTFFVGIGFTMTAAELWGFLYWPGVVCVYIGVVFGWMHLWGDFDIFSNRVPWARKLLASVVALAFLFIWTTKVVAVSAPLETSATATLGNYPSSTSVGGIWWDSRMDEDGRLNLKNPTNNAYKDADLYVLSDIWIVGAAKLSGIDDVKITPYDPEKLQIRGTWLSGTDEKGHPIMVPGPDRPLNLGHPTGVRIVADTIHARSDLEILLVMVAFNRAYSFRLPDKLFSQKQMPRFVRLTGTYKVLGRTRAIDKTANIVAQP